MRGAAPPRRRRPAGLPPLTINRWFPLDNIAPLMKLALIVWLIDLLESTSIARALAMKNGYKLNVTQVGGLAGWSAGAEAAAGAFQAPHVLAQARKLLAGLEQAAGADPVSNPGRVRRRSWAWASPTCPAP